MVSRDTKKKPRQGDVSLSGIDLKTALSGLLAIPDPDATKPVKEKKRRVEQNGRKAKKAPPPKKG